MADSYASDQGEMDSAAMEEEGDDVVAKEDEEDVEEESETGKAVPEEDPSVKEGKKPAWEPRVYTSQSRERFHFVGWDITIYESTDFYGSVLWPAASALCKYLETNREQINLMDRYVLELGAGTGLVSVVAALLGAWVTATDLPEILGNLRFNLLTNTRGRCKYRPQVAELSWSDDLDRTYPKSVYRYDYIMATDVVYAHEFLDDLLVTMKHFCQPGTKLIWANHMRLESDLAFTEKFKKTFDVTFLADVGEAKVFTATRRNEGRESPPLGGTQENEEEMTEDGEHVFEDEEEEVVVEEEQKDQGEVKRDKRKQEEQECHQEPPHVRERGEEEEDHRDVWEGEVKVRGREGDQRTRLAEKQRNGDDEAGERQVDATVVVRGGETKTDETERHSRPQEGRPEVWMESETEETGGGTVEDEGYEDDEENPGSRCSTDEDLIEETPVDTKETGVQQEQRPSWAQTPFTRYGRDVYVYAGQEISIFEALDTYGAVMWPAALALCHFLETNPLDFNLKDKSVLELGAGTGIVSIVASLLGASVTATDLSNVMANLRSNLSRNTSGRCRHPPQVAELSWGHKLDVFFPRSVHHYDYVLAADVVYHHLFLNELLDTMKHFCRPGTKLLWANKVRFSTDLDFTEDFKNAFHTTLLAELGVVKIFMATSRG